jgi:hypothetical protein
MISFLPSFQLHRPNNPISAVTDCSTSPGLRDIEVERGIVERLAIASGEVAVEPDDRPQFSRLREQRIARLQFRDIFAALDQPGIEIVRVGNVVHQEIAGAQRPLFLVQFGGCPIAQAKLIGGIVERARCPDRPVHEILSRIVGVGVAVEDVDDGELSDLNRQAGDVLLSGELEWAAVQVLLLATKAEGLAQEQPRGVVVRVGEA